MRYLLPRSICRRCASHMHKEHNLAPGSLPREREKLAKWPSCVESFSPFFVSSRSNDAAARIVMTSDINLLYTRREQWLLLATRVEGGRAEIGTEKCLYFVLTRRRRPGSGTSGTTRPLGRCRSWLSDWNPLEMLECQETPIIASHQKSEVLYTGSCISSVKRLFSFYCNELEC